MQTFSSVTRNAATRRVQAYNEEDDHPLEGFPPTARKKGCAERVADNREQAIVVAAGPRDERIAERMPPLRNRRAQRAHRGADGLVLSQAVCREVDIGRGKVPVRGAG